MRLFIGGFAILALLASTASAQEPRKLDSARDFSIKPSDLPQGCRLIVLYNNRGSLDAAEFTCPSEEYFNQHFTVSTKLTKECTPKGTNVVCRIKEP